MSRRRKAHFSDKYSTLPDRRVVSRDEAIVNLILAIKRQAVLDDRLSDWETYWLGSSRIAKTLTLLFYTHASTQKQSFGDTHKMHEDLF